MRRAGIVLGLLLVGEGGGIADPKSDAPRVDWERGLVIAGGVGVADRHAPSPAVARGTARRGAEDLARKALTDAVAKLPIATGGTVGDKLGDAAVAARVKAAVDDAFALDADPETDGAWHVTMAVPVEAIRQAITGPRAVTGKGGDTAAPVVIVKAKAAPAIGYTVAGHPAATVFAASPPAWAKGKLQLTAKSVAGGTIEIDLKEPTDATVFVIVP